MAGPGIAVQPTRRSEIPWVPMALLVVGAATIVLLVLADAIRQRSGVADARQLRALQEIVSEVAISHLWLEEYVSGDAVDEGQIEGRLYRALALLDSMIGSATENPDAPLLHTAPLRRAAAALRRRLEEFGAISRERRLGFQRGLEVGIGSPLDVEYDAEFEVLLSEGEALRAQLEDHQRWHRARARRLLDATVGGWAVLLLGAVLALWQRERHRHRAEAELEESRRQLHQTQKMEVAGRVAGGLAHDLANYLAAIRGHCEWVQLKHPEPERLDRKMGSVLRTVDRATGLIDRLLAFARRRAVRAEPVDLGVLLGEVAQMLETSLGDRIMLDLEIGPDLWPVAGDLAQIEQAVVNLVINARDAMPEGGTVEVGARNRPVAGARAGEGPLAEDMVELWIADQGVGIAPEHREQIFEPFWSTKQGGGSGLGLAVVYGVAHQHGGWLEVASEVGQGTTFRWHLPRAPVVGG